ncbi:MAG: Gfo/Idh/MocA family oxidoreductase [Planctomycetes bacterium]|nr:Gfo/Idh/MocA family oxidoreductase [Planctomycetota bacterium]
MPRYQKPQDITVGVVGYGGAFNMGKHHLTEMQRAGMTPLAVTELDPERLKVAQTDFPGIETYRTVDEMLKKSRVGLVTMITPHNTHADLAIRCLNAGRHAVCEKPLAITTAECDRMLAAATKKKLLLSTYHNRHWDGSIMRAVKAIRSGAIGDVVRIEAHMGGYGKPGDWWRSSKSISGGILYDWGVHLLEYSLQILDDDITEVTGFAKTGFWAPKTKWKKDGNEDEGFAVVRFKKGTWLTLCITSIDSNPKRGMIEITGTKGTYWYDYGNWELTQHRDGEVVVTKGKNPESEGWRFYQNVADHLVKGTPLVITTEWARRPIHILDLAGQSAKKGASLKPKYR